MNKTKYEQDYVEADKYVIVNNNDPDLRPIVLSLPEPPPIHLIEGYGLPIEEQRFKRITIPRKLVDLEKKAIEKAKKFASKNVNRSESLLRIQKIFWELIYARGKEYKKEINFIRKVWWWRLNGYWFYNRGKPTYITGRHFYYLNFFAMDTKSGYADYRDCDRREYIFKEYCWTATETFEKLDEHGYAIPEEDGSYKMVDLGRRICFGDGQTKNRRRGNTSKACSDGLEVVTRTIGTGGFGIQSYTEDSARSHFKDKVLPAWMKLPIWLKPFSKSGRTSDSLRLDVDKNDYSDTGLGTQAVYATTSSSKFFDGKKMMYLLTDEEGKCFGKDTEIRMYDGSVKKVQDIKTGDVLMGDDSTPRNVTSTVVGHGDMFRIVPNKGKNWTCNGDHVLVLKKRYGLNGYKTKYETITVDDFVLKSNNYKQSSYLFRKGFIDYRPTRRLNIDFYIFGLWLADGRKNMFSISVNKNDIGIRNYLETFCKENGLSYRLKNIQNNSYDFKIIGKNKTWDYIVDSGVKNNKHVPSDIIRCSRDKRLNFIAGYIDGDGNLLNGNKQVYSITSSVYELIRGVVDVAKSVGLSNWKIKRRDRYDSRTNKTYTCYDAILGGNVSNVGCKLNRKKIYSDGEQDSFCTGFKIEPIGKDYYYGFTLDGNRKFLLEDNTVAHNTNNCSVSERWGVNKHTLAQGDGRIIRGYSSHPSTVDQLTDGSGDYQFLMESSNFYRRIKSKGQTVSGLFRIFIPAQDGLEGFIDSHGYSVTGEIKDYQRKEGFTQTAEDYLQGELDLFLKENTPESKRKYREHKQLFPMCYADSWMGTSGDIGFDMQIIDNRLSELRRKNNTVRGNLEWIDGVYGKGVYFEPDNEKGKFFISKMPFDSTSNKLTQVGYFNPFEQQEETHYRIMYPGAFTIGVDPFRLGGKADERIGASIGKHSKLSDGGITVFWNYDESLDGDKPKSEWESYKIVATYRNRSSDTDVFNEDVLKAAIFWAGMIFPETNVVNTYEYIVKKGYGACLLYDIDKFTGRIKPKPGVDSLERSKQELFSLVRDYIYYRGHKEDHEDFLRECKDIGGMEQMRFFDILASAGVAMIGAKSAFVEKMVANDNNGADLADYLYM